ncbi:DUF485 domain-containing protein [Streptomyces sp. NK08204]|uniref:DUF485 domain-containing protein n=1 Tax=Streptomyces sp. NK08204 TaxID=2873260 RepID=UPI001CEDD586|nr:DUF485 domain-containing protein [Streptomyces sp. NK08204]
MSGFFQPATHHEPGGHPGTAAQFGPPPAPANGGADVRELRRIRLAFGTPAAVAVVGGYLLLILLSDLVPGLMDLPLFGHVTLGLALGLALFAALFLTAWYYERYMRTRFDPLAEELRAHHRVGATRSER